ncbi:hypothetical protein FEM03_11190 [Phragmitibacter flavus]|uniref:Uncharacterized protein n=1 Tax=Phragmitibacter flavus TaxID=2576071 RepID=A0A5R8KEY2_9BACT|nr:hypothetical protein [Phragmitibacter flavus]TLD70863.1 hypothetical protein FEM03_11190 [Phragmitibacter flavus]
MAFQQRLSTLVAFCLMACIPASAQKPNPLIGELFKANWQSVRFGFFWCYGDAAGFGPYIILQRLENKVIISSIPYSRSRTDLLPTAVAIISDAEATEMLLKVRIAYADAVAELSEQERREQLSAEENEHLQKLLPMGFSYTNINVAVLIDNKTHRYSDGFSSNSEPFNNYLRFVRSISDKSNESGE